MKKGGGKAKGANFERHICRLLSQWVSNGKRDDLFWRSAMSGGRATLGARSGSRRQAQVGDISAIDPAGASLTNRYVIEIKHVRDLGLDSFILKNQGALAGFWKKLCKQAEEHGKAPLLIGRQNNGPIIALTDGFILDPINNGPYVAHGRIYNWTIYLFHDLLTTDYPYTSKSKGRPK